MPTDKPITEKVPGRRVDAPRRHCFAGWWECGINNGSCRKKACCDQITNSKAVRNNGQAWMDAAARRKERRVHDERVVQLMNAVSRSSTLVFGLSPKRHVPQACETFSRPTGSRACISQTRSRACATAATSLLQRTRNSSGYRCSQTTSLVDPSLGRTRFVRYGKSSTIVWNIAAPESRSGAEPGKQNA